MNNKLNERTGRPLENEGILTCLEKSSGRLLKPKMPGRRLEKKGHSVPDFV